MINLIRKKTKVLIKKILKSTINQEINNYFLKEIKVFGDPSKLILEGEGIELNNTFFNCLSGKITIENHVGIAHNCMLITGSHNFSKINHDRSIDILYNRDIKIESGVFIGAGSIILGPCVIGKNSVIGAGSVVTQNIPENVIAVGNPCKVIKDLILK